MTWCFTGYFSVFFGRQICLENALRHMVEFLGCPVQGQELVLMLLMVPSNPAWSVILWFSTEALPFPGECTVLVQKSGVMMKDPSRALAPPFPVSCVPPVLAFSEFISSCTMYSVLCSLGMSSECCFPPGLCQGILRAAQTAQTFLTKTENSGVSVALGFKGTCFSCVERLKFKAH